MMGEKDILVTSMDIEVVLTVRVESCSFKSQYYVCLWELAESQVKRTDDVPREWPRTILEADPYIMLFSLSECGRTRGGS